MLPLPSSLPSSCGRPICTTNLTDCIRLCDENRKISVIFLCNLLVLLFHTFPVRYRPSSTLALYMLFLAAFTLRRLFGTMLRRAPKRLCTNAVSGTRFCHGYCQAARRNTKGKDMLCWRYVCFYFPGCRIARSYNHHSPLFQMDLVLDDHKLERNKAGLGFPSNYDLSAKFNLSFSDSIT